MELKDAQEYIILLVTIQTMLENGESRSDVIKLIDDYLYKE